MKRLQNFKFNLFIAVFPFCQIVSAQKLPTVIQPHFKKDTINIARLGAKNDGITLNTKTIQNFNIFRFAGWGGID